MVNQFIAYLKQNKRDIGIFALIGGGVYLFSKRVLPQDMSVLQASFGAGVLGKVIPLELQTLALLMVFGIALGLVISSFVRRK